MNSPLHTPGRNRWHVAHGVTLVHKIIKISLFLLFYLFFFSLLKIFYLFSYFLILFTREFNVTFVAKKPKELMVWLNLNYLGSICGD